MAERPDPILAPGETVGSYAAHYNVWQEQRRIGWDARQAEVDGLRRDRDELRNALMLATRGGDIEWGKRLQEKLELAEQNFDDCRKIRKRLEAERDAAIEKLEEMKQWREPNFLAALEVELAALAPGEAQLTVERLRAALDRSELSIDRIRAALARMEGSIQ